MPSVYLISTSQQAHALAVEMSKTQNDLKVKEIHLLRNLKTARNAQWPKAITETGVSVAPLAGIAFHNEPAPINLIPMSVKQTQQQRTYQRQLVILSIWVTAAMVSLGLALGMGFFKKNVQLAKLNDQIRSIKQDGLKVEKQLQKVHDIEYLISHHLIFADLARGLSQWMPSQVYLVSITIADGKTLSIQGVSSNPANIYQFQKNMVNSQQFSNVALDYANKRITQQGEVDYFKFTCTLRSASVQI
jgi:Tfp pilus assembly protein PilN